MKYLLDTHVIIWYFEDSPNLPLKKKEIIDSSENSIYLCSVSLWEIAIKINLNKLKLNLTFSEFLNIIKNNDFDVLQIEDEYLEGLLVLPFIHKDPFDRLILATAIVEGMTLITADEDIHKYNVPLFW